LVANAVTLQTKRALSRGTHFAHRKEYQAAFPSGARWQNRFAT
jgi:hypothetical protein